MAGTATIASRLPMASSVWKGTIVLSLVSIPVRLYAAARSERTYLHQIHKECNTRVRQPLFCPHCNRFVERNEIVKGYEFDEGQYVLLEDKEIKKLAATFRGAGDRGVHKTRGNRCDFLRLILFLHRRGQREKGLSVIDESLGRHGDRRHRHAADAPAGLHGFPSPLSARSAAAHHVFRQ